ncbi:carbohydrate-binding protein [Algibacillus agarilyticus]|uniref:carbohydrate-binding protein n=1 Tax=Algibacillus agarilyticus TaxID=2234133 RepID=UPI000DD0DA77|nr:carbohydrate-binding protein [Algibacillus agarilyticus]
MSTTMTTEMTRSKISVACSLGLMCSLFSVNAHAAPGYNNGATLPTSGSQTIYAVNEGVTANDGNDDSAALQAIIDGININNSASNKIIIKLPAGVINLHDEVHVDRSGIIIEGAGSDPATGTSVVINSWSPYGAASDGAPDFDKKYWPGFGAFRVETRLKHNNEQAYEGSINFHWKHGIEFDQTAAIGDSVLHLESNAADLFEVGDLIYVGAANDTAFLDLGEVPSAKRSNGHITTGHMRTQIFKVQAKNTSNDTITLDKPLEFDIPKTNSSGYKSRVMPVTAVEDVGFRDFHLTMDNAGTDCATYNTDEYDASSNPNGVKFRYQNVCPEDAIHGLIFKWAYNGWVENVNLEMVGSHPIVTEFAKNMTFLNNTLNGSWNKGAGGNGYFRGSKLYDSLIKNNDIKNVRHLTLQWSATGNVVEGNDLNADLNLHGGWERNNIIRNNTIKVPFEHRSWTDGAPGTGTWQPIWYASGDHATNWSGPTGPNNVFVNNTLEKALTAGAAITTWGLFDTPDVEYAFGWDGTNFKHLNVDGAPVETWTQEIAEDVYAQMPSSGVTTEGDVTPVVSYAVGDVIEAENHDEVIGTVTTTSVVGYVNKGDGMIYNNVNFADIKSIIFDISGVRSGHQVEIRKGSKTGTLLGTYITSPTGGWGSYEEREVVLSNTATGVDKLVIYVNSSVGGSGGVMNLDKITLSADTSDPTDPLDPPVGDCQTYTGSSKVEFDLTSSSCITFSSDLSSKNFAAWDSNANESCDFRGTISSVDGSGSLTVNANYAASSNLSGQTLQFSPNNGCQYIKIRAY